MGVSLCCRLAGCRQRQGLAEGDGESACSPCSIVCLVLLSAKEVVGLAV